LVRVPTYEGPQVRPTPLRAEQSIRAPEAAFGGATAQAVSQVGKDIGQVASLLDRRAEEHGKEDAELAAFNAYSAASAEQQKLFYEGDTAIYRRRGAQAMGSTNEAAVELKRIGEDTGKGLTSPYAQEQFSKLWSRHQNSEMGAVSRHEAGQRQEFRDQTTAGILATSQNQAALRFNDEGEVNTQIGLGEMAIRANTKGLPPDQVQAHIKTFTSGVRKAVVLRRMLDDPLGADAYFREHANDFEPDDIVTLERALKVKTTQAKAVNNAKRIEDETTVGVATIKTEPGQAPPTRTFSAMVQVESGGRQVGTDGKLLVSSAGNFGISQINDASGGDAAKALNIEYDPALARATTDEGKAYNLKLGQKYHEMMLERFGGNETLAMAAYNAGPGNVEKWIQEFGDPRTGALSEAAWVAKLPASETRGYVAKVRGLSNDKTRIDLEQAYKKVDEIKDPEEREQTRTLIEQRQADIARVRVEKQRVARDRAQDLILGGARYEDVPGELLADMDATAQQALKTLSERVRKGEDIVSDPETLYTLQRKAGNWQEFSKYDLRQDWPKLSETDRKHFGELQRQYLVAGDRGEAAATGERTRVQIADDTLRAATINPNAKAGTTDATKVKAFNEGLDRSIRAWKIQNEGKQPNSDDIRKMADQLVISGSLKGTGIKGYFEDERLVFELTPEDVPNFQGKDRQGKDLPQITPEIASIVREGFKKANGRDPTGAELLSDSLEYLQWSLKK
jgi:hypothetical protein